ncbi:MAG: succinylglutamate desuccinylase/aspartoacylase family protein [Planctomycetaceae bacterium]
MDFTIGGVAVPPGEKRRIEIPLARLFTQTMLSLPVTVFHGVGEGPRVWLDAALHGDELNGTEIIRRVLQRLSPARMNGVLVAAPVVNVFGFVHQSRYLPDRKDLNRSFPGSAGGSLASRIAHLFLQEVVSRCSHGVDLHTGSLHRSNLPQVRANLDDPETLRCARAFGGPLRIHMKAVPGSLRDACVKRGIPILVFEAGEPLRFNEDAIATGTAGILRMLAELGMIRGRRPPRPPRSVEVRRTIWVRSPRSGILHMEATIGARVRAKQRLGQITDPFGASFLALRAPRNGIVIGCTNNPLVNRGDAVVHLAVSTARKSKTPRA